MQGTKTKEPKNTNKDNLNESPRSPESKKNKPKAKDPSEIQRKDVIIIGDSILNGLSEQGLRKRHNVKIRAHSGATSLDIKDHIRPIIRRKPDCVLIHCGTNDLTKKDPINTTETIKEIIPEVKKESPYTAVALSSLTIRKDRQGMSNKIDILNKSLKKLTKEEEILIVDNSNIDTACLRARQLHLNRKGVSTLARIMYFQTMIKIVNMKVLLEKINQMKLRTI